MRLTQISFEGKDGCQFDDIYGGWTVDASSPLEGAASMKFNGANVEYGGMTVAKDSKVNGLLVRNYVTQAYCGFLFKLQHCNNTNSIFSWTADGDVIGGLQMGADNRLHLWLDGSDVAQSSTAFADNTKYHLQVMVSSTPSYVHVQTRLWNSNQIDLEYYQPSSASASYIDDLRFGSYEAGGSGYGWIDDIAINDQRDDSGDSFSWPGVLTFRAAVFSENGTDDDWYVEPSGDGVSAVADCPYDINTYIESSGTNALQGLKTASLTQPAGTVLQAYIHEYVASQSGATVGLNPGLYKLKGGTPTYYFDVPTEEGWKTKPASSKVTIPATWQAFHLRNLLNPDGATVWAPGEIDGYEFVLKSDGIGARVSAVRRIAEYRYTGGFPGGSGSYIGSTSTLAPTVTVLSAITQTIDGVAYGDFSPVMDLSNAAVSYQVRWQDLDEFEASIDTRTAQGSALESLLLPSSGVSRLGKFILTVSYNGGGADFAGYIDEVSYSHSAGSVILKISGDGIDRLLSSRVFLPPAGYESDSYGPDAAETIMKTMVNRHLINPITTGISGITDASRAVSSILNEDDKEWGDTVTFEGRGQRLIDAMKEIARVSAAKGEDIGFGFSLVGTGTNSNLMFYARKGADLSDDVRFAIEYGNIGSYSLGRSSRDFATHSIVGGQGAIICKTVDGETRSGAELIEYYVDGSDLDTSTKLEDKALATLQAKTKTDSYQITLRTDKAPLYGIDFMVGDIVTIEDAAHGVVEAVQIFEASVSIAAGKLPEISITYAKAQKTAREAVLELVGTSPAARVTSVSDVKGFGWAMYGDALVGNNQCATWDAICDGVFTDWVFRFDPSFPPSGGSAVADIRVNGTSIFSSKPTVTTGNYVAKGSTFSTSTFSKGDVITWDIVSLPTTAGQRPQFQLNYIKTG